MKTLLQVRFVPNSRGNKAAAILRPKGYLVQVGNGIELEAVGFQFEPYRWRPCGVTWNSSRTVVVIKLRRTSALSSSYVKDKCPQTATPASQLET